jgi:SAM-dependent methyltransferase
LRKHVDYPFARELCDEDGIYGVTGAGSMTAKAARSAVGHVERLREQEFRAVQSNFTAGSRVLEIGGGNGFQASLMAALGCDVRSIDVSPATNGGRYFPVEQYDGSTIPCGDAQFDLIFTSNVLEHIGDLEAMLQEIHRALKSGGVAIHVLPTSAWRWWTSLAHYVHLGLRVVGLRRPEAGGTVSSVTDKVKRDGIWRVLRGAIVAGPHGEYPSALAELYYFSKRRWLKLFRNHGFEATHVVASGIFYTGYSLLPGLSFSTRRRMAKVLGSATLIYVLRKA